MLHSWFSAISKHAAALRRNLKYAIIIIVYAVFSAHNKRIFPLRIFSYLGRMIMNTHAGTRWYKCDLHLHTMRSECYIEKNDTPKQWVARAIEQGLSVVAVTDHNDYRGIDAIIEEGKAQGLSVFPGVEITCDSSKIHMLILFDIDKSSEAVRDFLNRCDIYSELIGRSEGTSLSVFEVCEIAKKRGAVVIASHIDEFNAINSMNPANLDKILDPKYIDAVQVVNVPVWRRYQEDKDFDAVCEALAEKYGSYLSADEIDRWRKCYDRAAEAGIPMLAFSDNPCAPNNSKHGLWGIGSAYTWIQMDDIVDLESLKQSLVAPDERIKTIFDSPSDPKFEPNFWIRSIEVRKTTLNPHLPIHLDFHPQLNCIIGGTGSGKSALISLLSGVYQQLPDGLLRHSLSDQQLFYTTTDHNGYGIFTKDSEIDICYTWYGNIYRLLVTDIHSTMDQKYQLLILDPEKNEFVPADYEEAFYTLMDPQVFVQWQINSIAATPERILESIDKVIIAMYFLNKQKSFYIERLTANSLEIDTLKNLCSYKHTVDYAVDWMEHIHLDYGYQTSQSSLSTLSTSSMKDTAALIDDSEKKMLLLNEEREQLMKDYNKCILDIHTVRTTFLKQALAADENYKMELKLYADRLSFYTMLEQLLSVDLKPIREDIAKLEHILFDTKNGIEAYKEFLDAIRQETDHATAKENGSALGLSGYFIHLIRSLRPIDYQKLFLFRPEEELQMFRHPKGVKRFFPMTGSTTGDRAAALLSLFLFSDTCPFIIDQPEDNIDNRVIYEELVPKLKRAKQSRQMIIVTQDANIVTNADAEMIIVMESGAKFVKVKTQGTIDLPQIRREICETLEGGEEAFTKRSKKYHIAYR